MYLVWIGLDWTYVHCIAQGVICPVITSQVLGCLLSTVCTIWIEHTVYSMLAVSRKLSASRVRSIWGWAQHCRMIKTISNLSRLAASWANHCQLDEHNDGNRTYWVEMWAELCTARLSRQVTDYVQYKWSEQSEGISLNSVLLGWAERWRIISNINEVSRAKAYPWTLYCSVEQKGDRLCPI